MAEPATADCDMPDFFAQDDFENFGATQIPCCAQAPDDAGRRVQSAGFQNARNQGHARKRIVRCLKRHFPESVVCRKIAGIVAQIQQVLAQQLKVCCFLCGYPATASDQRL